MTQLLTKILLWGVASFIMSCQTIPYTPAKSPKAFTDPRDGERYGFVEIDDRYWMTENMRYNVEGSKLNPDNPSLLYGRLYNWEQAMQACPEGWRLSTDGDWISLERTFIEDEKALFALGEVRGNNVKILKSKVDWSPVGIDSLKMNILPAGDFALGNFGNLGNVAGFWTSSPHLGGGSLAEKFAYYRIIQDNKNGVFYKVQDKKIFYSCRCVRSLENNPWKDL